ncbi:Eukaryotic translation initiation factor 3 subunit H (eIF3h) [Mucor velutinosus]|uniref:non-specific serine/threonine protein kinase n=1 Tax=Mucor velutinosus TaxID=708070 RepID=A0AAN7I0G3_9FUNG|nr:Eukaryotic translation initiation factor 3 subunit H (eIF3h) [Mucor velutinosus]
MSKYNIPMSNLTLRFQKEQRVFKQLTHKDALIDALISLYNNAVNQHSSQQESKNKFIELYKPVYHEINKTKLSLKDFQVLHENSFAEGAFGKVTIVKSTRNNQIYAMKTSSKAKLINQMDRSSPMEERLILSNENEEWLPGLYASFQDEKNLYLVMEYAPGGDLQGLLERRSFQPFNEQEARFYCAELILAVERVHQLGYMHRDIKPGNILIDSKGHIKLGDLGSCISLDTKDYLLMVGTMPYVSPEMCNSEGFDSRHGGVAYGSEVDWWSVGIVLYELLYGERPFTGSDVKIQMSLLNPKVSVQFDSNLKISYEARDLLSRLLCKSKDKRLTSVAEIKSHAFFKDVNWDALRTSGVPPFIPSIVSPDDVTFFSATSNEEGNGDEEEDQGSFVVDDDEDQQNSFDKEYPFIGYSYNNTASNVEKPTKTSSNQEFIAQLRQKRGSLEPKQWEEEKSKLKSEIEQLKSQHTMQVEDNKALQQKLDELEDKETQLQHLVQSLREENGRLKSSSSGMNDLVEENSRMKASVSALQHQLGKMEAENVKLTNTITSQNDAMDKIQTDYSKLQITLEELRLENEQRSREIQDSAQLRENISQQQDKIAVLQKDLLSINTTCDEYKKQISQYQSSLEGIQQSDTDKQMLLQTLQQDIKDLQSKLQNEKERSQSIEQTYSQKLSEQANDFNHLIQQAKEKCEQLQQELERQKVKEMANDRTMKRSVKSLPVIPATSSTPALNSPGEGRSILSTMWQRERDSLRNAQQALENSESQLAYAKKQVIRLKREIKCYQKYTFQQQQQQNGLSMVDQTDRNCDADVSMLKNHPDSGRLSNLHTTRKQPLSKSNVTNKLMASIYSEKPVDVSLSDLKNTTGYDSAFEISHKKNQALLDKIDQEKNFIKSTERTIAARARLVRHKSTIDEELEISLQRAQSTLASLESSLSTKKYSPSDFFRAKKPLSSTLDDLTDI